MRYPSIETIAWELTGEKCGHDDCMKLDATGEIARACRASKGVKRKPPIKAITIRKILDARIDPYETFAIGGTTYRGSDIVMSRWQAKLDVIDRVLETCGVETIDYECTREGYGFRAFSYCNTGDTYATTLVRDHETQSYRVTSWGDMVERHENRCSTCKRLQRERAA